MKTVIQLSILTTLAACQVPTTATKTDVNATIPSEQTKNAEPESTIVAPTPAPVPQITGGVTNPVAAPETTTLSYYKKSKTVTPNGHIHSYTATGFCMVYKGDTFCWDDGVKVSDAHGYTYFGISASGLCSGTCTSSGLTTPTLVTTQILNNMKTMNNGQSPVNDIFNIGERIDETCTVENGVIQCADFQIAE